MGRVIIGTHICVELLNTGYDVVVLDNLSNASIVALKRVQAITGRSVPFVKGDIRCYDDLQHLFSDYDIGAVIHCAGLKAVGDSVEQPLLYYDNNISGAVTLCKVMVEFNCKTLVFSSSATVYGEHRSCAGKRKLKDYCF